MQQQQQQQQQQLAGQIREHMEVVGSDGGHVGTVDKVEGSRIKLTKKDDPDGSGAHHHHLPLDAVASVSGSQVRLKAPAQQAKQMAARGGGTDEGMGANAGVTGAGTMEAGQMDMAGGRGPDLGGMTGGTNLRDGVTDTGAAAGASGLSGDTAPGTISGREAGGVGGSMHPGGGGGTSGRGTGGGTGA
ncbi:hypothetical protein GCM10009416_05090 [Craurococcus roseus]|uniref:DUF2171 domain-containing protein n=1 Tax=Craurococcus roseus TaxID=77585 RepID=A0ABN1EM85_9PROT